jgi:hypothetical protein
MAVDTLTLGVEGKASLWKALKAEGERIAAATRALEGESAR